LGSSPFVSPLAEELADGVLERFLRYVRIDTQAEEDASTFPSTAKQLDLSRLLVDELREIGLDDVALNDHGYVLATLPGTPGAPVIGLIAHVDTTPDSPGGGVTPIVHEDYAGGPLVLPGDPSQVIDPDAEIALAARIGHDIVTSDGRTLLGADDKAGVAEIMTAVAYLHGTSETRANVRIAFTVDEEVGRGVEYFDVEAFGAEAAYTLDGSGLAELEIETFSARQVKVFIRGRGVHPGTAKGKLVNAVKLAADLIASLPRGSLSPETTEAREGYVHPTRLNASSEEAVVTFIVRDHDDALLDEHTQLLQRLAAAIREREPRAQVTVEVQETYSNMRGVIEQHPRVVSAAEEAIRRQGLEPVRSLIRGGTDGSRLSAMGLPTPNL
jgi:tripeptide aminopeptidase